jgi:hypothetical protein
MRGSSQKDPLASRQFWPRSVQPGVIAADYDHDRPCGNCGYNLRGLPPRQPCPECGSVGGLNLSDVSIPFDDQPGWLTFLSTVVMVITRPHELARQVWRPVRLDLAAARRFRRICIGTGVLSIAGATLQLARHVIDPRAALLMLPVSLTCALVWLHALSALPEAFILRGNAPAPLEPRARAVAQYPSATFVLLPMQLVLTLVTVQTIGALGAPWNWLLAAGTQFALLALLLLPGAAASAWIVFELVDVSAGRAFAMAILILLARLVSGAIMLIAIPAMTAMLAARWTAG